MVSHPIIGSSAETRNLAFQKWYWENQNTWSVSKFQSGFQLILRWPHPRQSNFILNESPITCAVGWLLLGLSTGLRRCALNCGARARWKLACEKYTLLYDKMRGGLYVDAYLLKRTNEQYASRGIYPALYPVAVQVSQRRISHANLGKGIFCRHLGNWELSHWWRTVGSGIRTWR